MLSKILAKIELWQDQENLTDLAPEDYIERLHSQAERNDSIDTVRDGFIEGLRQENRRLKEQLIKANDLYSHLMEVYTGE